MVPTKLTRELSDSRPRGYQGSVGHSRPRTTQRSVGMTPFEALATATSNAGRFIATFAPKATPFGTVTVGARGDLLVVTANPLNDLSVLRAPMAVVRRGRVYSARQLDSIRVAPTS